MGKSWEYSEMAHNAKKYGGPENYIKIIKDQSYRIGKFKGKAEGKREILIAEGISLGLGTLIYVGYKVYETVNERLELNEIKRNKYKSKQAEMELIKGKNKSTDDVTEDGSIDSNNNSTDIV